MIGHKYAGYWRFYNIFKTLGVAVTSAGPTAVTSTANLYPYSTPYALVNPLWMDKTSWMITGVPLAGTAQGTN